MKCYSQRRLNPFLGIMCVIDTADGEAVTMNGKDWTLYLQNRGDNNRDIKYATWSKSSVLEVNVKLSEVNREHLETAGEKLLQAIYEKQDSLPFPLHDYYELWLLQPESLEPIALIDSACALPGQPCEKISWRAEFQNRNRYHEIQVNDPSAQLMAMIQKREQDSSLFQWFKREANHNGIPVEVQGYNNLVKTVYQAEQFPPLLIKQQAGTQLVDDYLKWQAPWLLMLQDLKRELRNELEKAAAERALEVESCYRLYPEIIDQYRLNTILVEAGIRRGSGLNS